MQKRKMWWLSGSMFSAIVLGLTVLTAILKHEPASYRLGQVQSSDDRKYLANRCLSQFVDMFFNAKARTETWGCDVSEAEMNCFFEEAFARSGEGESLRKLGISDLNVSFHAEDHLTVAFRYGSGWFSTVMSYDLKIWLVPKEPNVIAVQVRRVRAGGLPISSQANLQMLSEFAREKNYKVTLYRHESCPVAVIELQPYQPHPEGVLNALSLKDGKLTIQGRTSDHALLPPPAFKAAAPR